jgi:hypothetical protein
MPLLNEPGMILIVVPATRAEIWSMPDNSMCRDGHVAWYADTGGWCDTCSVRKPMRMRSALDKVGTSPASSRSLASSAPTPRLRLDIWASRLDSTDVAAVEGDGRPPLEKRLAPLLPLRTDTSSDGRARGDASVEPDGVLAPDGREYTEDSAAAGERYKCCTGGSWGSEG